MCGKSHKLTMYVVMYMDDKVWVNWISWTAFCKMELFSKLPEFRISNKYVYRYTDIGDHCEADLDVSLGDGE